MARYLDVKNDLLNKISEGVYKSGDKIPSERDLTEVYKVSRMTVRQAINELERDGSLYREKGRGTFVSAPNIYQENLKSFTQTLSERNMTPSTKVVEVAKVIHLQSISQILDMPLDTPYYKIKRIRCGDGIPIALETVYIPVEFVAGIDQYNLEKSLYGILEKSYGYDVVHIACEIEACISNRLIDELMELRRHSALLKVTGVTYSQNEKKLFYEESYYRSELFKYHVDINSGR